MPGHSPERQMIVGIGTSAGGLAALRTLLGDMPTDTGLSFVVVLHLDPGRESHMADLLRPHCRMPVLQVQETVALERNHVYIIPPNANLNTIDTHLRLSRLEESRLARAPIDHFFRTLADSHDGHSIGVILTGTGTDGTLGLRRIKEGGGVTIAQDPEEAEFDGMPRSAIAAGVVDFVLPLARIGPRLIELDRTRPRMGPADRTSDNDEGRLLQKVFAQVRARTSHDFSQYKRSTMLRRIGRRMQIHRVEELAKYLDVLRDDPREVGSLLDDLLITVTEFFRDREVFDRLERDIVPRLFDRRGADHPIRVWSVGCATGEEAYSLAMLLLEEAGRRDVRPRIQIFASDLHEQALARAREGAYPETIAADVSAERLRRFFAKEDGTYRIRREVREQVVFAAHDLLKDPPFSRLDLIVCRNVLIYLQRDVQHDVISMFHYALDPDGLLLLGTAETIENSDLFLPEDKSMSLYRRRGVPARDVRLPAFPQPSRRIADTAAMQERRLHAGSYGALHAAMVERYAPPSILVNEQHEIVHYSAHAGRFLQLPGGEPTNNLFKLVREPLRVELRAALHAAAERGTSVWAKPIPVLIDGEQRQVIARVRATEDPELRGYFLVIFDETEEQPRPAHEDGESQEHAATVRELGAEIELHRHRLQTIIEEYETTQEEMRASNEEMRASNEEMQSTNEELRSTMEELETSKEELQSMNEELTTVNQENRHRVEELSQLSGDLQNLLAATDIATVFLDRELRIVRWTPRVGDLFNVRASDRGRPLSDLTHRLLDGRLQEDARRVLDRLLPVEREVRSESDRVYLLRVLPYRSVDDRIAGVVITLVDITDQKRHAEIREQHTLLSIALDAPAAGACEWDWKTGVIHWSDSGKRILGFRDDAEAADFDGWLERVHPDDRRPFEREVRRAVAERRDCRAEFRVVDEDGAVRYVLGAGRTIYEGERPRRSTWMVIDVTARKRVEEDLRESLERERELARALAAERHRLGELLARPAGVWLADRDGRLIARNRRAEEIWRGASPLGGHVADDSTYVAWSTETGERLPPDDDPMVRALRTGNPVGPVRKRIRRFDGTVGTVLVSAAPLLDGDGALHGVVGIHLDVPDGRDAPGGDGEHLDPSAGNGPHD